MSFATKRAWSRLCYDFSITEATKRRLLPSAFVGDARKNFDEVAKNSIGSSVEAFWEIPEDSLCNKIYKALLQAKFFDLGWNERHESLSKCAQKLRFAIANPTKWCGRRCTFESAVSRNTHKAS